MPTNPPSLEDYKKIADDYILYIVQQKEKNEGTIIDSDSKSAPLSRWRNALTGIFYNGEFARFFLWDMLSPKSEHANFIALIDRIAKLDVNAETILKDISAAANNNDTKKLLDYLFNYFTTLQKRTQNKDDTYYKQMKALKRDIHHLARQCEIDYLSGEYYKRIIKLQSQSSSSLNVDKYTLTDQPAIAKETEKERKRWIKSWLKLLSKIAAGGMGFSEIFITFSGLALLVPFASTSLIISVPLYLLFGVSGLFCGYVFAKDELFELAKQCYTGRIFQIKNSITGEYESLKNYQIASIILLFPFTFVAGFCIASITFTSLLEWATKIFTASASVPVISCLSLFVFCLATATFFMTIKNIMSHITKEGISEYFNTLKRQADEDLFVYGLRSCFEIVKWAAALTIMSLVAVGGYYLFKDKSINMLAKVWSSLPAIKAEKIASVVSFLYSSIKFVFGIKKITELLQSAANYLKATFSARNAVENPMQHNPIQKQDHQSQNTYTGIIIGLGMVPKAIATGAFYHEAGVKHPFAMPISLNTSIPIPPSVTGTTALSYVYAINAVAGHSGQKNQAITPLRRI